MSVEEAVEAPRNQVVKNREVITYKGKTYKMWSEFFEKNPLFKRARGSIQERRQKGMSIEEALDDYAKRNFMTDHKGNVFRNNKERSLTKIPRKSPTSKVVGTQAVERKRNRIRNEKTEGL